MRGPWTHPGIGYCWSTLLVVAWLAGPARGEDWVARSPRDEIRPAFARVPPESGSEPQQLTITTDERAGLQGWWESQRPVEGGAYYRFTARVVSTGVPFPRRSVFPRIRWTDAAGRNVTRDEPVLGPFHQRGSPAAATPELPIEVRVDDDGTVLYDATYRAPSSATQAVLELHLQWATEARAVWSDMRFEKTTRPAPRPVRLATIHLRPSGGTPAANCRQFAPLIAEAAAKQADLVVLPETLTFYGVGKTYAECAEPIPGPSTDYFAGLAKQHRLHLVVGLLEREAHVVYNVAVLIGPEGQLIGKYRKVCLPRGESEGGIMPGDAYPVFETSLGRIGMMVCYDGFFPEVARRLTEAGAEVIAFPVWGCNPLLAAARACENNVYVVSSTYTDVSSNWMISGIYGPDGTVLSRAESWGSVAIAEVDLATPARWASLGDFGAEMHRNRPPSAREYADAQVRPDVVPQPRRKPAATIAPLPREKIGGESGDPPAPASASFRIVPQEPDTALQSFHVRDGFRLQLLAAEPLIEDPVAMEYDEWGRAYVVEMRDYPYTDKSTDKPFVERTTDLPLGRVRLLVDQNGDGVFDRSTIFAEDLSWPTGLALWQGGVFVTATPDLWYLKDSDGDGRADVRRKIFTGFRKFNVQAVINNLKWGVDHKIYGAGSSNGGTIVNEGAPSAAAITLATNDFRFDPLTHDLEALSGGGRFGLAFDDWGNRFICNIRNPIRQAVFPDAALKRNPLALLPAAVQDVAEAGDTIPVYRTSPPEPWRIANASRLAADALTPSPRSETVAAGYMTSACGLTIYRGSAYSPAYYGQAFLGEVAGNLIHRQQLVPQGIAFSGRRLDERSEFVTSDDNWFRPVNFVNAPDGTLHVLDMYRETIEHPWSMPDDLKALVDLESGRDRGRIYRLAPPGFAYAVPTRLGDLSSVELVAYLQHANGWHRDTAHRLLFERQDPRAVAALRELARGETGGSPVAKAGADFHAVGRALALWSLQGLHALEADDVLAALRAPEGELRRQAVDLVGRGFVDSDDIRNQLLQLSADDDIRVRFEVALALATCDDDRRTAGLKRLVQGSLDSWLNAAIVTSAAELEPTLLEELVSADSNLAPPALELARQLAEIVAARGRLADVERVLKLAQRQATRAAQSSAAATTLLTGLAHGSKRAGHKLTEWLTAAELKMWVRDQLQVSSETALDGARDLPSRTAAFDLLTQLAWPEVAAVAERVLAASEPPEIQLAATRTVLSFRELAAGELLLAQYRQLSPPVRVEILQGLAARPESARLLLDAIQQGELRAGDLSPTQRGLLLRSRDASVQERARQLLASLPSQERGPIVARYRAGLQAQADLAKGEATYRRICANCHHLRGVGTDVGPPLETVLRRSAEELLLHILDPSREVLPNYQEYIAQLDDGRTVTGMIAEETPTSITLRRAGRVDEVIARRNIEELVASGKSLMPEGLENELSPADVNDLIEFLRQH